MSYDEYWQMSHDDVRELAQNLSSPVLYHAVDMYDCGQASWRDVMQFAACILAEHVAHLTNRMGACSCDKLPKETFRTWKLNKFELKASVNKGVDRLRVPA